MRLTDLLGEKTIPKNIDGKMDVLGLSCDSRTVLPGYLFAALPGVDVDGARFIDQAIARGANIVLTEHETVSGAVCLHSDNPRQTLAGLAARFFEFAPETMIAVTGTNGKTSVVEFYRQIVSALGQSVASLGTLGINSDVYEINLEHTTPEPVMLHASLRDLYLAGVTHLAIEASSHGLAQHRLDGGHFKAAAFTNLSRDHLDYHSDEADYVNAKKRLFTEVLAEDGVAVINLLGARASDMKDAVLASGRQLFSLGALGSDADLTIGTISSRAGGLSVELSYKAVQKTITLPVVGAFQAENFAMAVGLALVTDFDFEDILATAEKLTGPKGRMERVGTSQAGAGIYIDYAHTPDALENALTGLRSHMQGRLICVFGCGGNRDAGKRGLMGKVAASHADIVIVTDDNSRDEDPAVIRRDIIAHCQDAVEIADRSEAIAHAVQLCEAGDVVIIAGKGHETGQIIGDKVLPFSDHDVVASLSNLISHQMAHDGGDA